MIGEWFGERTPLGSRPAGGIGKLRATINSVTFTNPAADVPETGARGPTAFATTHWSLIVRAADGGTAEGRAAMAERAGMIPPVMIYIKK